MLIEFETPFEGMDAFDTDFARHEDLALFCSQLAREVERLRKEHARILKVRSAGFGDTEERKLAWAIIGLVGPAGTATAVNALLLASGALVSNDDHLSSRDITRLTAKFGQKIAEYARHFRTAGAVVGKSGAQH